MEDAIAPIDGSPHFDQIATMVGEWYRTDGEAGDGPIMIFELAANGSAVVERLFPGMEKEMATFQKCLDHFEATKGRPVFVLGNHTSFLDLFIMCNAVTPRLSAATWRSPTGSSS